jgi:tRNA dimethylallyltransferase
MHRRRLVAVVGPTASGKSSIAIELAQRFNGEIFNADSRQVYRGMDVGTAKPTPAERAAVPHHLYDVAGPADSYSLALYREQARAALDETWARGRLPLLVGGTGQYAWAVLENWSVPAVPPDDALRAELSALASAHGPGALHDRLRAVDPIAASRIDARNVRRVVRALEVFERTGVPISTWQQKRPPDFEAAIFGVAVERAELLGRIDARAEAMFAGGFVAEVEALLAGGVAPEAPAMSSIGYGEIVRYLRGALSLDEARDLTKRATRRLARRQGQWFRPADPRITWVTGAGEIAAALTPNP